MLTRFAGLCLIVGAILVGFSFVNRPEEGLYAKLVRAQEELTAPPIPTATDSIPPMLPTPTESPTDVPTSPSPELGSPTPEASDTVTVTLSDTPLASATAAESDTPLPTTSPAATETVAPSATATDTTSPTPTFTPTPSTTPVTEVIIDANGGEVSSPDGHVSITFPPGATAERLQIEVSDLPLAAIPPLPGQSHKLSAWSFDAKAIDRNYAEVHQFSENLMLDIRYDAQMMFGLNESDIHYWSYDEATSTWLESTATLVGDHEWSVSLNHFSDQSTSSDETIVLPPGLDAAEVSRSTGTITYNVPIQTSPGLGGLAPHLSLAYNSEVVDDSPQVGPASWVGAGWNLSMPSITRQNGSSRYFINLNGIGDELIKSATTQNNEDIWVTRHQSFVEVRHAHDATCDDLTVSSSTTQPDVNAWLSLDCRWTVRDQSGNVYVFGGDQQSRRYYFSGSDGGISCSMSCKLRDYQWDLFSITNTRQQQALYAYHQIFGSLVNNSGGANPPYNNWVISSFPSTVTYPGGQVRFTLATPASDSWSVVFFQNGDFTQKILMRSDARDCVTSGTVARVFESQSLQKIEVFSQTAVSAGTPQYSPLNEYDLSGTNHDDTPAFAPGLISCGTGNFRLDSVDVKGDADSLLQHYSFSYEQHVSWPQNSSGVDDLSGASAYKYWLKTISNGFGGTATYYVAETIGFLAGTSVTYSSRFPVVRRVATGGFDGGSNPDINTRYFYDGNTVAECVDASGSAGCPGKPYYNHDAQSGDGVFRGYKMSTAATKDAGTVRTSSDQYSFLVGEPSESSELAGRVATVHRSGDSNQNSSDTSYAYTVHPATVAGTAVTGAYFDTLDSVTNSLTTNGAVPIAVASTTVSSNVSYTYDQTYGFLTTKTEDGDLALSNNDDCRVTTFDDYHQYDLNGYPGTTYFVVPKSAVVTKCGDNTALSETVYGYDGTAGGPTASFGDRTSVRQKVHSTADVQQYVYTLNSYTSGTGTLHETSVPIYGDVTLPTMATHGRTETSDYWAESGGRFPKTQVRHVYIGTIFSSDQTTQFTYNLTLGLPESIRTPDQVLTETRYDEFGRTSKRWQAPDTVDLPTTQYAYNWTGGGSAGVNSATITHNIANGSSHTSISEVHCYDGLGRETQVDRPYNEDVAHNQRVQRVETIYDGRGFVRNSRTFDPYAGNPSASTLACSPLVQGSSGVPNHIADYDNLGNVVKITENDGNSGHVSVVQMELDGRSKFTYDQLGHRSATKNDGFGRVVSATTYTGATNGTYASYATSANLYDVMNDNTRMTENVGLGAAEHSTNMVYDMLGRETSITDSDLSWGSVPRTSTYDAAGNPLTQTDARPIATTMTYDSANRLLTKNYFTLGSVGVTFRYDTYASALVPPCDGTNAVGHMTAMTDGTGSTTWCYDARALVARTHHEIRQTASGSATDPFDVYKTYDSANRLVTLKYPDTELLTYSYDDVGGGKLRSMSSNLGTYINGVQYDHPNGAPTEIDLGATSFGYKTNYAYDALYRLLSIVTSNQNGSVTPQNLSYDYWANGNIKNVTDAAAAPVDNLFYNYDELNRLVNVRKDDVASGAIQASYSYGTGNDLGKLTSMMEGGVTTSLTPDATHVHAVAARIAVDPPPPTGSSSLPDSYTYDKDGNLASRVGGETYAFDAENRLSAVASYPTRTDYWYDGLGNMDCRWTTTPGFSGAADVRDRYVDGLYEEHSVFGQTQYTTKNYVAFGRIIAQRKTTTGANPTSTVTYLLADHLGSTVGTLSESGASAHMQYYPFGNVRSGHVSTDRGFTGQRREGSSRLGAYFYNARFYATGLAHFMSADSSSKDGLDRYAYARFNPILYSDPTGNDDLCDAACWQTLYDLVQCAQHSDACNNLGGTTPTPTTDPTPTPAPTEPTPTPLCGTGAGTCAAQPTSGDTGCTVCDIAGDAYDFVQSDAFQCVFNSAVYTYEAFKWVGENGVTQPPDFQGVTESCFGNLGEGNP